jgi:hypothetical protein
MSRGAAGASSLLFFYLPTFCFKLRAFPVASYICKLGSHASVVDELVTVVTAKPVSGLSLLLIIFFQNRCRNRL